MSNAVPEGWRLQTIGELVKLQYGKSPKEVMSEGGQYPVIGTGGVTGYASSYLFDGCTTVIGRKGTINKPSYVEGKFWAIDTTYFGVDYKGAEPKWFYYSLNSFDLTKYNEASGVPSLGRDTLNAIPLSVPPLPEQQKIAAILSSVDDVIEKTRAQIDKLKDLKTGMMQELLTKGIGHTAFKDSPVGRIPEGWDVVRVGELAEVIDPQPDHRTPAETQGGIPYVGLGDIGDAGVMDFAGARKVSKEAFERQVGSFDIHPGAFIFGKIGTIGKPFILPEGRFYCLSANIVLVTTDNIDFMKYLYQVFSSGIIDQQVLMQTNTTSQPALGIKKVREFLLPLPSDMAELDVIVKALNSVDTKISQAAERLTKSQLIKRALMQDLLTGKVRVNVDNKENAVA